MYRIKILKDKGQKSNSVSVDICHMFTLEIGFLYFDHSNKYDTLTCISIIFLTELCESVLFTVSVYFYLYRKTTIPSNVFIR